MKGTHWAEVKDILPEADLHIQGTIPRAGGKLEFWMSAPRPKKYSVDEWDRLQEEKWNRIFPKTK